jgi:hypothetical protein
MSSRSILCCVLSSLDAPGGRAKADRWVEGSRLATQFLRASAMLRARGGQAVAPLDPVLRRGLPALLSRVEPNL